MIKVFSTLTINALIFYQYLPNQQRSMASSIYLWENINNTKRMVSKITLQIFNDWLFLVSNEIVFVL